MSAELCLGDRSHYEIHCKMSPNNDMPQIHLCSQIFGNIFKFKHPFAYCWFKRWCTTRKHETLFLFTIPVLKSRTRFPVWSLFCRKQFRIFESPRDIHMGKTFSRLEVTWVSESFNIVRRSWRRQSSGGVVNVKYELVLSPICSFAVYSALFW
jgi:hypothetical protein